MITTKVLVCPICQGVNLHQEIIQVFDVENERGPSARKGRRVVISHDVKIDSDITDNPSFRRQGLSIEFWCEAGHRPVLDISQHKGSTILKWKEGSDVEQREL